MSRLYTHCGSSRFHFDFPGPITFNPTYKYTSGTAIYDRRPNKKKRFPAWCDRILYHPNEEKKLKQLSYFSTKALLCSDHMPVAAVFKAKVQNAADVVSAKRDDLLASAWSILEVLHFQLLAGSLLSSMLGPEDTLYLVIMHKILWAAGVFHSAFFPPTPYVDPAIYSVELCESVISLERVACLGNIALQDLWAVVVINWLLLVSYCFLLWLFVKMFRPLLARCYRVFRRHEASVFPDWLFHGFLLYLLPVSVYPLVSVSVYTLVYLSRGQVRVTPWELAGAGCVSLFILSLFLYLILPKLRSERDFEELSKRRDTRIQ
jgi:hypothetical protein